MTANNLDGVCEIEFEWEIKALILHCSMILRLTMKMRWRGEEVVGVALGAGIEDFVGVVVPIDRMEKSTRRRRS